MAANTAYHKKNLLWPILWAGGSMRAAALVSRYQSALRHLVATMRGAFFVDPEYGTNAHLLRTQSMSEGRIEAVLADIRLGAARYIPDIVVTNLSVDILADEHKIVLSVFWVVRGANTQMHGDLGKSQVLTVIQ